MPEPSITNFDRTFANIDRQIKLLPPVQVKQAQQLSDDIISPMLDQLKAGDFGAKLLATIIIRDLAKLVSIYYGD